MKKNKGILSLVVTAILIVPAAVMALQIMKRSPRPA